MTTLTNPPQNNFRMGRVNKAESKVTMMIGVMIILFMVAWTPYSVFALLEQFGPGVSSSLAVMPALLAKSSICYNPIIYVGMNSQVGRPSFDVLLCNANAHVPTRLLIYSCCINSIELPGIDSGPDPERRRD